MTHMKNLLQKIKYPKLFLLTSAIILAYVFFQLDFFETLASTLNHRGYVALFLGGLFFAFGFTAPFAVALFIELAPSIHPLIGALLGGAGAFFGDLLIFHFVRVSFQNEFELLKLSWFIQKIKALFDHHLSETVKKYILWSFAGILIASPLPDEFGVTLLSGFTNIDQKVFGVISFLLNSLGIMIILLLPRLFT